MSIRILIKCPPNVNLILLTFMEFKYIAASYEEKYNSKLSIIEITLVGRVIFLWHSILNKYNLTNAIRFYQKLKT